jgi:signal peptidase II
MAVAPSARWLWLALVVLVADRATKYAVERFTTENFRRELIPDFAALVHSRNTGIAFGLFADSQPAWVSIALMLVSAAVVFLLAWLLLTGRVPTTPSQTGLALLAGGAAGNLIDRLLHGAVTDFLELHVGSFYWPAFNLADAAITVGAALMVIDLFRGDSRPAATPG